MLTDVLQSLVKGQGSHAYCLVGDTSLCEQAVKQIVAILAIPFSEAKELAAQSPIVEVRAMVKWLVTKPLNGQYKVFIVPLENMRLECVTTLLKTVEEPPPHGIILLTAKNTQSVMPTIKSRCQVVWLGDRSKEPLAISSFSVINAFLEANKKDEAVPASSTIDQALLRLEPSVRSGKNQNLVKELLELKQYSLTNANSRLLLEYAALIQSEEQ